jgi:hypothetical protein
MLNFSPKTASTPRFVTNIAVPLLHLNTCNSPASLADSHNFLELDQRNPTIHHDYANFFRIALPDSITFCL